MKTKNSFNTGTTILLAGRNTLPVMTLTLEGGGGQVVPQAPSIPSIPQVGRIDTPSGYDNAGNGGFDYCSQVKGGRQACYAAGCMRRKGLCVKKRSNRGNRGGNVHTSQTNGCNTVMNGKCVDGICLKDCPNSCAFSVGNCCHACA